MKNKNVGFIISTVAFCFVAVAAIPLRTYQLFTNIEPDTGFFINGTDMLVYLLYAILTAGIVISVFSSVLYKNELGYDRAVMKRPVQGVISLITGFTMLFDMARVLVTLLNGWNGAGITSVDKVLNSAMVLFGILSAIFFVVFAISMFSGATNASEYKLLSLAIPVWFVVRLVSRFTTKISFVRVSELTIEIFMLVFMLLFFLSFAQLNSKIESKGIDWKIVGYGIPAAVLALVCFIPRIIVAVTGNADLIYQNVKIEYCDAGCALFTLSVVFSRIGWTGGNADSKDEAAEAVSAPTAAETAESAEK